MCSQRAWERSQSAADGSSSSRSSGRWSVRSVRSAPWICITNACLSLGAVVVLNVLVVRLLL